MSDLRFLARRKALTGIAVLTMGLAIGATAASLSVLKTFLFESLAVPEVDRLVLVQPVRDLPGRGAVKFNDAYPNYQLLREAQRSFVELAVVLQAAASWDDKGETRQLAAARASASFGPTFRTRPLLGRWFAAAEEGPSPAPVVVLSHHTWQTALGANPGIVGTSLLLNGAPHTVIGVMPPGFDQPTPTDIWLPFDIPAGWRNRITGARQLVIFARLADGVTFDAAQRDMQAFTARALEVAAADNKDFRWGITTLRDNVLNGADATAFFVLAGAAGLILLAVLNLSSLLIAWGFERQREFAVRMALGAGSRQVIRLVLRQSLVVAALAGVAGIALSGVGLWVLQGFDLGPMLSPLLHKARIDGLVLAVTLLITVISGSVAGMLPSWFSRGAQVGDTLRATSRSSTMSRSAMAWQKATVLGQTALSVVILFAAGLIALSFWRLAEIPDGFVSANRVVARVVLPDSKYATQLQQMAFGRALHEHMAAEPGLVSGGFTTALPVSDIRRGQRFSVEQREGTAPAEPMLLHARRISPSYLATMGIPLLRGRAFTAQDDTASLQVAIVSRALAERLWPDREALGERLERVASSGLPAVQMTVVGVVGNAMDGGYDATPGETVYMPYFQLAQDRFTIVAEGRGNTAETMAAIRNAVRKTDPVVAAGNVATLEALVLQANALPRLRAVILIVFALAALGIVALGAYGVMSQLVSARQREFALRLVFGARPAQLGRIVLVQSARITVPGIAAGLVAAWLLSGALRSFVFGVDAASAPVFTTTGAVLLLLTAVATIPSAVRAMRVDVRGGTE
jgi:putative ABC transport system permease protein